MKLKLQIITLVFIFFNASSAFAYHAKITSNITYAEKVNQNGEREQLEFDLYQPTGNVKNKIIYLMHGGGFLHGEKEDFVKYSNYLAKHGFTVCNLNYRLIPDEYHERLNSDIYATSLVFAMDDLDSAIRFIQDNSDIYDVDDHEIIIGGYSAGALTSLHYAYINSADDLFLLSQSDIFMNLSEEKQSFMTKFTEKKYKISKVISIAGSLLSPYLMHEGEPSIISVHSVGDEVVPYESGDTDGTGIISYGSKMIHQTANNLSIMNQLITVNDDDHGSFGNGIENENCQNCRTRVDEFLSR